MMRKEVRKALELLANNGKWQGARVTRTDLHRALFPRRMEWCGLGGYRKLVDDLMLAMVLDGAAIFEPGPRGGDGLRLKVGGGDTTHNAMVSGAEERPE